MGQTYIIYKRYSNPSVWFYFQEWQKKHRENKKEIWTTDATKAFLFDRNKHLGMIIELYQAGYSLLEINAECPLNTTEQEYNQTIWQQYRRDKEIKRQIIAKVMMMVTDLFEGQSQVDLFKQIMQLLSDVTDFENWM